MSKHKGENIREVWEYRLSTATPRIMRGLKTWIVEIWSQTLPDHIPAHTAHDWKDGEVVPGTARQVSATELPEPLAVFDTGIETGDDVMPSRETVAICYDWLRSVRDDYSRPDIEKLKPRVAAINKVQAEMAETQANLSHSEAVDAWLFIAEVKRIADGRGVSINEAFQLMVSATTGGAE